MAALMTGVAEDGLSVVFSSHVVPELERVASYLIVLSGGQVQVAATVEGLLDTHRALIGPARDGTFGPLAATGAAAAAAAGLVYDWWYQVAQWASAAFPYGGWNWVPFGLVPQVFVGWTVFGLALALPVALLVRRTVPAMAACAAGFVAVYMLVNWQLRDWLLSLAPVIARGQYGNPAAPSWNDLFLRGWLTGPGNDPASSAVIRRLDSMTGTQPDRWIGLHHYTYWVAYQPHDRLQLFQFAVAAILLAAAAALTLAATWLLRRHPPE